MFYDSFMRRCELNRIKPTPLLKSLGLSAGSLNRWRNGTVPSGDILIKLADALNCTVDDLLERGRTKENAPMPDGADTGTQEEYIYKMLGEALERSGLKKPGEDITAEQADILIGVVRVLRGAFGAGNKGD